jgi:hypothetical protein
MSLTLTEEGRGRRRWAVEWSGVDFIFSFSWCTPICAIFGNFFGRPSHESIETKLVKTALFEGTKPRSHLTTNIKFLGVGGLASTQAIGVGHWRRIE